MKRRISLLLALIFTFSCFLFMTACSNDNNDDGGDNGNDSSNSENNGSNEGGNNDNNNPAGDKIEGADVMYVEMEFAGYGKIVIEVDCLGAPITANNFLSLVKSGFYNGLTIFRAQNNFVIQGGKNESVEVPSIKGEFAANGYPNPISHTRGVISMARTSVPDSATSQFFITLSDSASHSLDSLYAAFGRVISGMDVVDAVASGLMSKNSDSVGFVSDSDAIKINYAKIISYDPVNHDKTNVMGTGACEYLESRDTTGRDIKYVEMCVEGYGKVVILLDATTAPVTVANFISLVEKGFYDGLTFHRIIKDFMIQGGDPKADGTGNSENTIKGEFSSNGHENDISHKAGVISMARSNDPNSASCQFFICNADASSSLDGNYASFGYVVEGMSVINEITSNMFQKTDFSAYHGNGSYDNYFQAYKYVVWQYLGNGAISNKLLQPKIKYIKVLDSWEK